MNLAIDIGNTRVKAASFTDEKLVDVFEFESLSGLEGFINANLYTHIAVCSVKQNRNEIIREAPSLTKAMFLNMETPRPIEVSYDTPETLGMDRLASAIGAQALFPSHSALIIDLGTCITYDLLEDGVFQGGMIAPGIALRLRAMHEFTANLPLLDFYEPKRLIGKSTKESMVSGVFHGILGEIEHHISQLMLKIPDIKVIMTGGNVHLFESKIKSDIFVAPELVLVGLNGVLKYNA